MDSALRGFPSIISVWTSYPPGVISAFFSSFPPRVVILWERFSAVVICELRVHILLGPASKLVSTVPYHLHRLLSQSQAPPRRFP